MDKKINGIKVRNIENLIAFIEKNLKTKTGEYDLNACVCALDKQHGETGLCFFELAPFETVSGNPERIDYEVEEVPMMFDPSEPLVEDAPDFWEITYIL